MYVVLKMSRATNVESLRGARSYVKLLQSCKVEPALFPAPGGDGYLGDLGGIEYG
jgi:hypothetical protein